MATTDTEIKKVCSTCCSYDAANVTTDDPRTHALTYGTCKRFPHWEQRRPGDWCREWWPAEIKR